MVALQSAMAGQSYTINGVTYNRQNVGALKDLIDWLDRKLGSSSPGGSCEFEVLT